jgi:hypothetical protein
VSDKCQQADFQPFVPFGGKLLGKNGGKVLASRRPIQKI